MKDKFSASDKQKALVFVIYLTVMTEQTKQKRFRQNRLFAQGAVFADISE